MPQIDELQERAMNTRSAHVAALEKLKNAIEKNDPNLSEYQKEVELTFAAYNDAMADFDTVFEK